MLKGVNFHCLFHMQPNVQKNSIRSTQPAAIQENDYYSQMKSRNNNTEEGFYEMEME